MVKYFGENPKTTPPSVFFPVFVRFVKAYKVTGRRLPSSLPGPVSQAGALPEPPWGSAADFGQRRWWPAEPGVSVEAVLRGHSPSGSLCPPSQPGSARTSHGCSGAVRCSTAVAASVTFHPHGHVKGLTKPRPPPGH